MENTLFIGNGLNRCLSDGVSWGNLLADIAHEKLKTSYNSKIDMPLEFERIINEYLDNEMKTNTSDKSEIYTTVKKYIKNIVDTVSLPADACIHKEVPFDKVNSIITTNYDTLLEETVTDLNATEIKINTKYLFKPSSQNSNLCFYHAHGIKSHPKTMCLGYEHYMGMVANLRNSLNSEKDDKMKKEMRILRVLNKDDPSENTWCEKFYTSNIAFIGFGLPSCESDIWWLLTHRAYLFYSNYHNCQTLIKNKIVYYDIFDRIERASKDDEEWRKTCIANQINKHRLLEKFNVDVRTFDLVDGENYSEKYRIIFREISDGSCWD